VVYPRELRHLPLRELEREFTRIDLCFTVLTHSELESRFTTGKLSDIQDALGHANEHLVQEDEVSRAAEIIDAAAEQFAQVVLRHFYGRMRDIAEALEMPYQPERKRKAESAPPDEADSDELSAEE
ncbi:MAG: hypothetical protein ACK4P1_12480, partial [Aggregatilineales bacterium]